MAYRFSVAAICLLAVCGCSGGDGSPIEPTATTTPIIALTPTQPTTPTNTSFTGLLNGARTGTGANAVSYDARLGQAAQGHANDMLANGYFAHAGLNGSSAGDRIRATGYNPRTWGENIARGPQSEAAVFEAWQNSSGHRANNLNPNFEDFALARAGSGSQSHWVLVFASEQ
jgi:uncharacterized protein YkwD